MAGKYDTTSRKAAKQAGETTYLTGMPCPNGHVAERYTVSGGCVVCAKERSAQRAEYYRERYQEKRDQIISAARANYKKNSQSRIKRQKQWAAENKELVREVKRSYKLRRKGMEADGASAREVSDWAKGQTKICHWCEAKCPDDYHVDHYFPLSKGGKHEIENLVISCPTCNIKKNAKDPYEFAQERGRLF